MPRLLTAEQEKHLRFKALDSIDVRNAMAALDANLEVTVALIEALKAAIRLLDRVPLSFPYNDESNDVRISARAAISKAEGRDA